MKGIEHNEGGSVMFTGEAITTLRLTMLLRGLGLEMKGIKMVRHSVYAQVKRELGFKGNKQSVYDQLAEHIRGVLQKQEATKKDVDALLDVGKI